MDFRIPTDIGQCLGELEAFIELEIKSLEPADASIFSPAPVYRCAFHSRKTRPDSFCSVARARRIA